MSIESAPANTYPDYQEDSKVLENDQSVMQSEVEPTTIEAVDDSRTDYQKAIDLAWQVEGLDVLLRKQGNNELADTVERATLEAFMLHPNDSESIEAITEVLSTAIAKSDNYDSGERKYDGN